MTGSTLPYLLRQLDTAWRLTWHGLADLTTEACLWRPADKGLHVLQGADGAWRAEWPTSEGYDIGPPSIAWITWHMGFWWSMALNHNFGGGTLRREDVLWPGDAEGVRAWLSACHDDWQRAVAGLSEEDLASPRRTRWPYQDRPFGDVVAWANLELTKNAAELGYARFLHAVSAA